MMGFPPEFREFQHDIKGAANNIYKLQALNIQNIYIIIIDT